jgi:hypothetical protein
MTDNMDDLKRMKALEVSIGTLRKDLERVERMLRLTPTKHRLKERKGSIEKLLFKAQGELGKVQKEVAKKLSPSQPKPTSPKRKSALVVSRIGWGLCS